MFIQSWGWLWNIRAPWLNRAELNLLAPLSCSVGLGPEDKHIRACSPSYSWLCLDTFLISARLFKVLHACLFLSSLPPALREEGKWEQTSIWLRGCGGIEWKCGKLNIGFCLGFSYANEGTKCPLVLITMAFLILLISLLSVCSPALWDYPIVLGQSKLKPCCF